MSGIDTQTGNSFQSPTPQFSHDPNFIAFRSWATILSLKGTLPAENPADSKVLFLDEHAKDRGVEMFPSRGPACLRNPTRFTHLNITIICTRSNRQVFFAKELPARRFLHLAFLKEGTYTLYYSPAFTSVTLHRQIKVFIPVSGQHSAPHNFHPQLQTRLQTSRAGLSFNSPFSKYMNEKKRLPDLKDCLPTLNGEDKGESQKKNPSPPM